MMDKLANILDVEPDNSEFVDKIEDLVEVNIPEYSEKNDFNTTRTTKYKMLSVGEVVLANSVQLLQQNPNPRSVEVITQLLKTLSDISESLTDIKLEDDVKEKEVNSTLEGTLSEILNKIENNKNVD